MYISTLMDFHFGSIFVVFVVQNRDKCISAQIVSITLSICHCALQSVNILTHLHIFLYFSHEKIKRKIFVNDKIL